MRKPIEVDFPFEKIDPIAELESWRKEINRPIYHIHKWWANRLGSVFRAILLGAVMNEGQDIWHEFYQKHNFNNKIVLDPFMGSGTTLGECAKLGIRPIGCDINPVSSFIVRQSLTRVDINELKGTFHAIESDVKEKISKYYMTIDPATADSCNALYYFWVKVVKTPSGEAIPLFSNYVFSKNAYPRKKPLAKIFCSNCGGINTDRYDSVRVTCEHCGHTFNPQVGPANGQFVTDSTGQTYKVKDLIAALGDPPEHRLYAIMALTKGGEKVYLKPTQFDFDLYAQAVKDLEKEPLPLPNMPVRSGYNTNQARGYNYLNWRQFFNERQLLCLGLLLKRILKIEDDIIRDQFLCLFSSTLEFNSLFCSFKGEGTGAVRHMFSHHILKPERTPLENTVWGTPKSSGTFTSLFRSRLLRAKEYLSQPFEISSEFKNGHRRSTRKVVCSNPLDLKVTDSWKTFVNDSRLALVLNGDSADLPIPDSSVDAVITDPPYFDFVHYSELSDFFFAWLSPVLRERYSFFRKKDSSDVNEVQNHCPEEFSKNLVRVLKESYRVLRGEGLLVFSFHHSRTDGWLAIYRAIVSAGFSIVVAHPVKAEMSVGSPKSAAKNPINIDSIIVCKKGVISPLKKIDVMREAEERFTHYCHRFVKANRKLSLGDQYVIMASQVLVFSSIAGLDNDSLRIILDSLYQNILHP